MTDKTRLPLVGLVGTTLALGVLVGAAVLLWWIGGPQLPPSFELSPRPAATEDRGTRDFLDELQAGKFSHIEVQAPSGSTELTRKPDGAWGLRGNWPGREAEVNALVALLAGLRSRFQPEPIDDKEWAELVGDRPTVTVKLTLNGDEHTLALAEKPTDAGDNRFALATYLRLDKKKEVLRLAPGLIAALNKPADYYQRRRLFLGEQVKKDNDRDRGEQLAAQSVHVTDAKGAAFTMVKQGSEWQLTEPVHDQVEAATRDALLAAVPDLWAERFVATGTGGMSPSLLQGQALWDVAAVATNVFFATQGGLLVRAGLIEPERTITAKYANGDTVKLQIGAVSSRRTRLAPAPAMPGMPPGMPQRMMPITEEYRFAKLEYNDQVFEIKGDKLKDVFVSLDTLRDARVARFNASDARRVEIKHGGEDIVLEKDKSDWKMVKPVAADADSSKVTDLLGKLSDLQARDKDILDKDDPKKYGFDKPSAEVSVTVEEESKGEKKEKKTRTLTVRVGKHDKDKKKLYVMAGDLPRINIVDDSLEPLVSRSAVAYRGKRLLDFGTADMAKIEIDNKGDKFALEQDKDGWRLSSPVRAEADRIKAEQLAGDLGKLEAVEFVNQSPKKDDLETQYGLGKPALVVKVEFTDKSKPAKVLRVGKARGGKGGYFAQLADGADTAPVFAINTDIHKELMRDSLSYRPLTLWQLIPEDVAALRIHKAGQKEYTLTRSDKDWKIGGPFEASASADAVKRMTAELLAPKAESYKVHEAKDLKEYGLDKPALTVALKPVIGKEYTLLLGKETEGGARYAKRADDPAVFVVADALARGVDRGALELLDLALLRIDPAKLDRVQAKAGDNALTLEKKDGAWRVAGSPAGEYAADADAASSLTATWADLRADHFVDYGAGVKWDKYGLDKPAVRVTAGASKEHTVELGKEVEDEPGARYARVDGGAGVAVLPPESARVLARTYLDYVNRGVLKFDADAATALQRHMGRDVLEVVKKDDAWKVTQPAEDKADAAAMRQLIDQLANLRAERIAAYPVKDLATYGLDSPSALVTVKMGPGQKPAEHILKLGKKAGDGGERFALADDGKAVAVLPGPLVERLAGSPLTFRDRAIARFDGADRMALERGPRRAVFAKVDGTWKLAEPMQSDAEQEQLDDFLNRLSRLRADALVVEKPAADDLKKYGLDHPEARWRLKSGDKQVLDLVVGGKEPKGPRRYAKLGEGELVFLLDAALSQKVLDEYRPRAVWVPPVDALQVESLNYRYASNPFLLEKVETAWQAVGKPDAKVSTATVEDTLAALAGLKLSRYAVDKGANLALFGLDKPYLVLDVATRSGKRVLHVGNTEGGSKRRYARVPGPDRSDVFVLDEATCERILRDLNAFTKPPVPAPPRAAQ